MSQFKYMLEKPQGYIRLVLCVLLPLGCGASVYQRALPHNAYATDHHQMIDVALTGGSVAAFTLLAAGSQDNPVGEVTFTLVYALLSAAASSYYYDDFASKRNRPTYDYSFLVAALFGGTILWIADFVLSVFYNLIKGRRTSTPATATAPEPEPVTAPEPADPKAKAKTKKQEPEPEPEPEPETKPKKSKHKKRASKPPEPEPEPEPEQPKAKAKKKK